MKNNVRRGTAAVVVVKKGKDEKIKYIIENDGIIDVVTVSGAVFKNVRCTGTSSDGQSLRFITDEGPSEVPFNKIAKIRDSGKMDYSVVEIKK